MNLILDASDLEPGKLYWVKMIHGDDSETVLAEYIGGQRSGNLVANGAEIQCRGYDEGFTGVYVAYGPLFLRISHPRFSTTTTNVGYGLGLVQYGYSA